MNKKIIGYILLYVISIAGLTGQNNALYLNGAHIYMNGGTAATPIYITINQPNSLGIVRSVNGGHIHSENQYNYVQWVTGTNTGSYVIPFGVGGNATDYIPLGFNKTNAANITLTVSTYSTNAANTPMPGASTSNGAAVAAVSAIPQAANAIDRYWNVKTNAAVNADLTFSYRGSENTIGSPPNFCATDTLKAQNWNGTTWNPLKGPGTPGVTSGIGTVGPIPYTTYGQFVLASVPISPTITASQSVTCNGASTGAATVVTTGGLGGYSYAWSPSGGSSSTASGLSAGNYTVTVTGSNGCNRTATVNIAQPPAISLTVNSTTVNCTSLASATAVASGGTPTYNYTWNPIGATTNTINNLGIGNYTVVVQDNNNCTSSFITAITGNTTAPVVTSASSGSLNCTTTTVQITTTVTPSSGINYNWTGPGIVSGGTTGTVTVNQGGTYQVTVTNTANNCTATTSQSVAMDNNVPSVQIANTNSLNCTVTSAQVSTTVNPVGSYTYNWTGPGIVSGGSTGTITVNQGGTYQVTVTNTANNCTVAISQNVTQNTIAPTVSASSSGSLTCTNTTVQITSTVNPTSVSYNWSGSGIVGGAGTGTVDVNQPGTYSLVVTDPVNTCTASVTNINIVQNTVAPTVNAGGNQTLTCSTPSVQLVGTSSPSTGVTINWLGGVCGSTNSFTTDVCAAGTYTLEVTNMTNGCVGTSTVQVIPDANLPSIAVAPSGSINCSVSNVQIVASTTVSPVSYTWSGSGIVSGNGTATVDVNQGGTYQVTVTNTSNGCSTSTLITVTENTTAPTVAAAPNGTLDCINTTVSITSTVNPSNVNYSWSGPGIVAGGGTGTITVNQPGTYSLVVTDPANTCTTSVTNINVSQNINTPTITADPNPTLTCASTSVSIGASSNPNTNVTVNWSGPNVCGATNTFTTDACAAGTYTIVVTDNTNGCSSTATISVIPDVNIPVVTANASGSITCIQPTIEVVASTTSSPVSYTWSGSGIVSGATTPSIIVNQAGNYTVIVTNTLNGCSTTQTIDVAIDTNSPSVTLSTSNASITCTNSTVDIYANPVGSNYTYIWSGAGTFTGQGTPTISTTTSGTYQVIVTNTVNGCSATQNVNIGFDNNLLLTVNGNTLVCQGSNIVINASGANTYTWTDGTNTYTTSALNIPATGNVTYTLVGQTGACVTSTVIGISVSPSINVAVSVSPNNSITIGDQVQLNATGASNYSWTPITGLDNPTSPSPIANPVITTTYCVIGIDNSGVCSDSACLRIYVDTRCPELFVPNVFSPNKDNMNDKLCVRGTKCVKEFQFVIFDRWGEKVFETTDVNACWDGTYKGKDMSGATFVYYIKGITLDDKPIDKKGNITIVK